MTPRKTDTPGSGTGGADYLTTTNTPKDGTGITTTDAAATAFGVMLDRELTSSRRCEGAYCWCSVGSTVVSPLTHDQEMARMFREIRLLEISQGVQL